MKILELQGTARRDRHGERVDLELDACLPECPDFFPEEARDQWRSLVSNSKYRAVLADVDRGMLELYCILRAEFRAHVRAGTEMRAARMIVMANVAAKLGLTPTDRTKLAVPQERPKADDELAAIARECGAMNYTRQ